jgi:hypothetical protein
VLLLLVAVAHVKSATWTATMQKATGRPGIRTPSKKLSTTAAKGGGRVSIGKSNEKRKYLTSALTMQSNTELNIPEGNVLLIDRPGLLGRALSPHKGAEHVAVTGDPTPRKHRAMSRGVLFCL